MTTRRRILLREGGLAHGAGLFARRSAAQPCDSVATGPARSGLAHGAGLFARRSAARPWAGIGGTTAVAAGTLMIGLLHTTGARLDPVSQPLSEYALTGAAWLFDAGVATVALGLGLILVALIRRSGVHRISVETSALVLCGIGLATLLVFPDVIRGGRLSGVGRVHWIASMIAFAALPVAPLLLGRRHRLAGCSALPRAARWLAMVATALLVVFVGGSVAALTARIRLWPVGGAVERALAGAELVALLLVGVWACRGCPASSGCRRHRGGRRPIRAMSGRRHHATILPGQDGEERPWRTACITQRPRRSPSARRSSVRASTTRSARSARRCSPTARCRRGPSSSSRWRSRTPHRARSASEDTPGWHGARDPPMRRSWRRYGSPP